MALIKCKECSAAVSDTVATCPQCGFVIKKPEGLIKRLLKGVAVGFLGLIILGRVLTLFSKSRDAGGSLPERNIEQSSAGGGTSDVSVREVNSGAAPTSSAQSHSLIGDLIQTKKFEITVTKAEIKNTVGEGFLQSKPAEGGIYVAVQWRYKNISEQPVSFFSFPKLYLFDPKKNKFSHDVSASGSFASELKLTEKVVSDLNPGITVSSASVFEVSKDFFNPKTWNLSISADQKFEVDFGVMQ